MVDVKIEDSKNSKLITGHVTEVQRFCVHDGPGIRTIVFLKGCPLRCLWCQNPEAQSPNKEIRYDREKCIGCLICIESCPQKAISLKNNKLYTDRKKCIACGVCAEKCYAGAREIVGISYTVDEVFEIVGKDKVFYKNSGGGVTLSGGEPLFQSGFSASLLKRCKKNGINTAIETSGFAPWSHFKAVLEYTDFLLFDLKVIDLEVHRKYTGQPNELIISNLYKASKIAENIVIRFPCIPGINDDEENLKALARITKEVNACELHILPYHEIGVGKYRTIGRRYLLKDTDIPSSEKINRVKSILESEGININIGGLGSKINLAIVKEERVDGEE